MMWSDQKAANHIWKNSMQRFNNIAAVLLIALGSLAFTSCKNEATTSVKESSAATKPTATNIVLSVANVSEFEKHVKSHAGKVVVVDLWAMW